MRPNWASQGPGASSPEVGARMRGMPRRDTSPELAVRRRLHAMGLRFRVHSQPLPDLRRRADVVFTRARVAVFIDGCFWHGCPQHGHLPTANAEWWAWKISRNRTRDQQTDDALMRCGWTVVRAWEHEPPDATAVRVRSLVLKNLLTPGAGHRRPTSP